jgi:hypothetical protein
VSIRSLSAHSGRKHAASTVARFRSCGVSVSVLSLSSKADEQFIWTSVASEIRSRVVRTDGALDISVSFLYGSDKRLSDQITERLIHVSNCV